MKTHRYTYKIKKKITTSHIIFEEFGEENCIIELIETYPCNSKEELNAREGYWIKEINCVNKIITGRTRKEYNEDNKTKILEYRKEYYETNRNNILEKKKEYDEKNREKILEYNKEYYKTNKDKLLENKKIYDKQEYFCEKCNSVMKIGQKSRHLTTKKHLDNTIL
jgi:hypothetical protein